MIGLIKNKYTKYKQGIALIAINIVATKSKSDQPIAPTLFVIAGNIAYLINGYAHNNPIMANNLTGSGCEENFFNKLIMYFLI
jgi:hypothetical protein